MVGEFRNSLMTEENWCHVAEMNPSNSSYSGETYQKVYALRYLPAYYFEYCFLSDKLRKRISREYTLINIASLGCGLCPDYYAFRDNLHGIAFSYVGYDANKWSTKEFMPEVNRDFRFIHKDVRVLTREELSNIDVYVFPKSIKDIEYSNSNSIINLASLIASSNKNRLFFLNSFVKDEDRQSQDTIVFKKIHDALLMKGFKTDDDYTKILPCDKDDTKLNKIHQNFDYPKDKFIKCPKEGTKQLCKDCKVIWKPILTNKFMCGHILEYVRE